MAETGEDRASVIAPPPLLFLIVLLLGFAVHWLLPPRGLIESPGLRAGIGLVLTSLSFVLAASALHLMWRHDTPVGTSRSTTAIVTKGAFRWSRNPLYLALLLLYAGIGVLLNGLYFLSLLPILWACLHYGVVLPEEQYLEAGFGEEYLRYKHRVCRWLHLPWNLA